MRFRFARFPLVVLAVLSLLSVAGVSAAQEFPALTGRVVDRADLLSSADEQEIVRKLENLERTTSIQVVVVTLRSLQGYPIEDFGYRLGREWGIGQKGKDNGLLLIVAPTERKVRIEVGYGLEGVMTDAQAKRIIDGSILPHFKANRMNDGIVSGVNSIVNVLAGTDDADETEGSSLMDTVNSIFFFVVFLFVIFTFLIAAVLRATQWPLPDGRADSHWRQNSLGHGWRSGGHRSGGGGFSGGGGSFGGGGASGGW